MKFFRTAFRSCEDLGLNQHHSETRKYPINKKIVRMFFILCLAFCSCCTYFFIDANTFQEYAMSVFISSTFMFGVVLYAIFVWKFQSILKLRDDVETIINEKLEQPTSIVNYVEVNLQIEKWTEIIHFAYLTFLLHAILFPKFVSCFYLYYATDLGSDALELPYPCWLPFDNKTPIGYLIAITLQYIAIKYLYMVFAAAASLAIGFYLVMMAFIKDIKNSISSINGIAKSKENPSQIMTKFSDSVQFHSHAKNLVDDASNIFQPMLSALFSWNIIALCSALLIGQMQISTETIHLNQVIIPVLQIEVSTIIIFIVCEIIGRINYEFDAINDIMNQYDWYLYPFEIQKMLPTILIHAQKPVNINCFGSIPCNRETFKKVTNCACSYFMMLREFGI